MQPPPAPGRMSHIFVSYVREDKELVDKLVADLERRGAQFWLDRKDIKPGHFWKDAIREAIEEGNFFLACFSKNLVTKERSVMNEELLLAVDEIKLRQWGAPFFIPVKLNACDITRIPLGAGRTLADLQWVELDQNWRDGIDRIAHLTLDLEKKNFKRLIDETADRVIKAEIALLRHKIGETERMFIYREKGYIPDYQLHNERVDNAIKAHQARLISYTQRFNEEYDPLPARHQASAEERKSLEERAGQRAEELIASHRSFELAGIGCAAVVALIAVLIAYLTH
jgi:hypothetical protein